MCGIIYVRRNDNHSPIRALKKRYEYQKSRGQQGFGFVAVDKDRNIIGYERSRYFYEIEKLLENYHNSKEILFHHRLPTSTPNTPETAHPIFVSNKILKYDYYVVHNGVIRNATELRSKHEALGLEYNTIAEEISYVYTPKKHKGKSKEIRYEEKITSKFNDSESLAIELALCHENIIDEERTEGSAAWVMFVIDKKTNKVIELKYGRNSGNPLCIERKSELLCISSECENKSYCELNAGVSIIENYLTKEIKDGKFSAGIYKSSVNSNNYSSYLNHRSCYGDYDDTDYCDIHKKYETYGDIDSCFTLYGVNKSKSKEHKFCKGCDKYHHISYHCNNEVKPADELSYDICGYCERNMSTKKYDDMPLCDDCYLSFTENPNESNEQLLLPANTIDDLQEYKPLKPEENACQCLREWKKVGEDMCRLCKLECIEYESDNKELKTLEDEYEDYLLSLDESDLIKEGLIICEQGNFSSISKESIDTKLEYLEEDLEEVKQEKSDNEEVLSILKECLNSKSTDDLPQHFYTKRMFASTFMTNILKTEVNLISKEQISMCIEFIENDIEDFDSRILELQAKVNVLTKYSLTV